MRTLRPRCISSRRDATTENNKLNSHSIVRGLATIALSVVLTVPARSDEPAYLGACTKDDTIDAQHIVVVCDKAMRESLVTGWPPAKDRYLIFYFRGVAEERLGQYDRAEWDFRESIKRVTGFSAPWVELGEMLEKLGHPDATTTALDAMVSADPHNPYVLNNACYARAVLGRHLDVALRDCDEALRMTPNEPNALDSRCLVRFRNGDFASAIGDCDAALKARPDLSSSLYVRGLAKIRLGYTDIGHADIAAAIALDPKI